MKKHIIKSVQIAVVAFIGFHLGQGITHLLQGLAKYQARQHMELKINQ